jgi:hypothetical protein
VHCLQEREQADEDDRGNVADRFNRAFTSLGYLYLGSGGILGLNLKAVTDLNPVAAFFDIHTAATGASTWL